MKLKNSSAFSTRSGVISGEAAFSAEIEVSPAGLPRVLWRCYVATQIAPVSALNLQTRWPDVNAIIELGSE